MPALHQIRLYSPNGTALDQIDNPAGLVYTLKQNDVGTAELLLPDLYWDLVADQPESLLEIYRSVDGGPWKLAGNTAWLCEIFEVNDRGQMKLTAYDMKQILKWRYVLWTAGSSQAQKTDELDDMMKAVMGENFGAGATAITTGVARNISSILSIEPNFSQGQSQTKAFAYRRVLELFQEMAQASAANSKYLAFDVSVKEAGKYGFEFRTFLNQRGNDHRSSSLNPVILAPELGNLADVQFIKDYSQEENYIYVAGQGEGADRANARAYDLARITQSPLGLKEAFKDARQTDNTSALQSDADSFLREGRPKKTFRGKLAENSFTRYGVHFDFGDQVTARPRPNELLDVFVNTVQVSLVADQQGQVSENLTISLEHVE
jgi:hypothetical protein